MRNHIVNCKIEDEADSVICRIQYETNRAYVELLRRILKEADISREEKILLICELQEKLKD